MVTSADCKTHDHGVTGGGEMGGRPEYAVANIKDEATYSNVGVVYIFHIRVDKFMFRLRPKRGK
jgi:hypothetical protein